MKTALPYPETFDFLAYLEKESQYKELIHNLNMSSSKTFDNNRTQKQEIEYNLLNLREKMNETERIIMKKNEKNKKKESPLRETPEVKEYKTIERIIDRKIIPELRDHNIRSNEPSIS